MQVPSTKGIIWKTLLIGFGVGIVGYGFGWLLRYSNAIVKLVIVPILPALVAGLIAGVVTGRRTTGFVVGCMTIVIILGTDLLLHPPDSLGITLNLLFAVIAVPICGLIGLFAAWLATMRRISN